MPYGRLTAATAFSATGICLVIAGTRADGSPAGYVLFFHQGTRLNCIEAIGDPEQILRVLAQVGKRLGCNELEFRTLPYHSALARRLRQGICREVAEYRRNGGCMLCLLNLSSTLEKLRGEFSRRLLTSSFAGWHGELLLAGEQQQALLAIDHGEVRVLPSHPSAHAIHAGNALARLLVGTETPEAIAEDADIEAHRRGGEPARASLSQSVSEFELFRSVLTVDCTGWRTRTYRHTDEHRPTRTNTDTRSKTEAMVCTTDIREIMQHPPKLPTAHCSLLLDRKPGDSLQRAL